MQKLVLGMDNDADLIRFLLQYLKYSDKSPFSK